MLDEPPENGRFTDDTPHAPNFAIAVSVVPAVCEIFFDEGPYRVARFVCLLRRDDVLNNVEPNFA